MTSGAYIIVSYGHDRLRSVRCYDKVKFYWFRFPIEITHQMARVLWNMG